MCEPRRSTLRVFDRIPSPRQNATTQHVDRITESYGDSRWACFKARSEPDSCSCSSKSFYQAVLETVDPRVERDAISPRVLNHRRIADISSLLGHVQLTPTVRQVLGEDRPIDDGPDACRAWRGCLASE